MKTNDRKCSWRGSSLPQKKGCLHASKMSLPMSQASPSQERKYGLDFKRCVTQALAEFWQLCCCHSSFFTFDGGDLWFSPCPKDCWTIALVGLRMPRAVAHALPPVLWYASPWRQQNWSQLLPVVASLTLSDCIHNFFFSVRGDTPSFLHPCSIEFLLFRHPRMNGFSFRYFY